MLILASNYETAPDTTLRLDNTLVDADLMRDLFRRIAVSNVRLVTNPTADVWENELTTYLSTLRSSDTAVLYYAGHAVQMDGQNYFLTADGKGLVSADQVLSKVMIKARGAVFFIDACRDNPFRNALPQQALLVQDLSKTSSRGFNPRSLTPEVTRTVPATALGIGKAGLSQMGNLRGDNAIAFFSTEPGNVAVDGAAGQGSPFANAVATELRKKQALDDALRRISADVSRATNGHQSPWRQGDLGYPLFLAGEPRYDAQAAF